MECTSGCRPVPARALRDIDVFRDAGDNVTVGTSIPSFDEAAIRALEPRAPTPESRMDAMESFADAGVHVYLMASPTYPMMDEVALRALLQRFAAVDPAVVFHEPFNARSARMRATIEAASSLDDPSVADAFRGLTDDSTWTEYAVRHSRVVQAIGDELDLPVHICPHWQLTRATSGRVREWFEAWRGRQPPEAFAGRPRPDGPPPEPPADRYSTTADVGNRWPMTSISLGAGEEYPLVSDTALVHSGFLY